MEESIIEKLDFLTSSVDSVESIRIVPRDISVAPFIQEYKRQITDSRNQDSRNLTTYFANLYKQANKI